jgi:type II secretory pathway component GspD/PulD (secretin)
MKSPVRLFLLATLAGTCWIAPGPLIHAAEAELRVIPLKHRLVEEVVPIVRPLLAPGESVNGLDSNLIVRAAPPTLTQIERMLVDIDRPRRNLRISVRHNAEREYAQDSQEFSGDVRSGNTRIVVNNGSHDTGGMTIGRNGPNGTVQLHSERRVTSTRGSSSQNLTVQDGGRAFIRIGESIMLVQTFLVLVGNRPGMVTGIQYHDVTTGFEVEPRLLGEQIQLAVAPRLAFRSDQGTQIVYFRELSTVVTVKPGEWTDLGGAVESNNEVNRQILGARRGTGSEVSRFLVRVDPQ